MGYSPTVKRPERRDKVLPSMMRSFPSSSGSVTVFAVSLEEFNFLSLILNSALALFTGITVLLTYSLVRSAVRQQEFAARPFLLSSVHGSPTYAELRLENAASAPAFGVDVVVLTDRGRTRRMYAVLPHEEYVTKLTEQPLENVELFVQYYSQTGRNYARYYRFRRVAPEGLFELSTTEPLLLQEFPRLDIASLSDAVKLPRRQLGRASLAAFFQDVTRANPLPDDNINFMSDGGPPNSRDAR